MTSCHASNFKPGSSLALSIREKRAYLIISGLFVLLLVAVVGLIMLSRQPKVIPYIVEVETCGMTKVVGKLEDATYTPSKAHIRYFLYDFIRLTREISSDQAIVERNTKCAWAFLTKDASKIVAKIIADRQPLERMKKETVAINITSFMEEHDGQYRLGWTENIYSRFSDRVTQEKYMSVIAIKIKAPETEAEVVENPVGLFVSHIAITKVTE